MLHTAIQQLLAKSSNFSRPYDRKTLIMCSIVAITLSAPMGTGCGGISMSAGGNIGDNASTGGILNEADIAKGKIEKIAGGVITREMIQAKLDSMTDEDFAMRGQIRIRDMLAVAREALTNDPYEIMGHTFENMHDVHLKFEAEMQKIADSYPTIDDIRQAHGINSKDDIRIEDIEEGLAELAEFFQNGGESAEDNEPYNGADVSADLPSVQILSLSQASSRSNSPSPGLMLQAPTEAAVAAGGGGPGGIAGGGCGGMMSGAGGAAGMPAPGGAQAMQFQSMVLSFLQQNPQYLPDAQNLAAQVMQMGGGAGAAPGAPGQGPALGLQTSNQASIGLNLCFGGGVGGAGFGGAGFGGAGRPGAGSQMPWPMLFF